MKQILLFAILISLSLSSLSQADSIAYRWQGWARVSPILAPNKNGVIVLSPGKSYYGTGYIFDKSECLQKGTDDQITIYVRVGNTIAPITGRLQNVDFGHWSSEEWETKFKLANGGPIALNVRIYPAPGDTKPDYGNTWINER